MLLRAVFASLTLSARILTSIEHKPKMTAPNPGRQSPDPEHQTDAQQGAMATNVNNQGGAPSQEYAKEASDDQKLNLASNPTHPLAKHSEETTSKKG
jgi:hypothetical protein